MEKIKKRNKKEESRMYDYQREREERKRKLIFEANQEYESKIQELFIVLLHFHNALMDENEYSIKEQRSRVKHIVQCLDEMTRQYPFYLSDHVKATRIIIDQYEKYIALHNELFYSSDGTAKKLIYSNMTEEDYLKHEDEFQKLIVLVDSIIE